MTPGQFLRSTHAHAHQEWQTNTVHLLWTEREGSASVAYSAVAPADADQRERARLVAVPYSEAISRPEHEYGYGLGLQLTEDQARQAWEALDKIYAPQHAQSQQDVTDLVDNLQEQVRDLTLQLAEQTGETHTEAAIARERDNAVTAWQEVATARMEHVEDLRQHRDQLVNTEPIEAVTEAREPLSERVEFVLRGDTLVGVLDARQRAHGKRSAGL